MSMKAIYKSIKKSGKSIFETKEKEAAALSNTGVNDGFVLAVKEATIGSSLPLDLRTWKPHHVDEWLCDTFSGAQSLSKYQSRFKEIGVRGIDLLSAGKEEILYFGITDPVHIRRFEVSLAQLVEVQKTLDTDAGYNALNKQCDELKSKSPPYALPKKMEYWAPVDVFFFLSQEKFALTLGMFIRPLANSSIGGKELLEMCNATEMKVDGLVATDLNIKRLKETVLAQNERMKAVEKQLRIDRQVALRKMLVTITEKIQPVSQIGKGASGTAYLAEYIKKKKVVLKQINEPTDKKLSPEQLRKQKDDVLFEAGMLARAAGPGVLTLIGIVENKDKDKAPSIVTEYMCKNSLEAEYLKAKSNDSDSIFHPQHENNVAAAEEGMLDPVLLQKVRVMRDVAITLARLHDIGIIHLDISARNIFLDAATRPKIGDFGHAAMESDMVDLYEFVEREIKMHGGKDAGASSEETAANIALDVADLEKSGADVNAVHKFRTLMGKRPVKVMPEWVTNCGSPPNPQLDWHADVYSFGCLMYELAQLEGPHAKLKVEEVLQLKASKRGNPPVPANLDPQYARIMSSCWGPRDMQPRMDQIAQQLTDLHKQLLKNSYRDDDAFMELKDLSATLQTSTARNSMLYGSVGGAQQRQKEKSNAREAAAATPASYPKVAGGRIRLLFPEGVDINDVEKIIEYQEAGVSKDKLSSALRCAYHRKDCKMIADYMSCIRLDSSALQVQAVITCLEYIEQLAQDEHGDTENSEVQLCGQILRIAEASVQFNSSGFSSEINRPLLMKLLIASLGAIGALLKTAALPEELRAAGADLEDTSALFRQLDRMIVNSVKNFAEGARLVEKAATAAAQMAVVSDVMLEQGIVTLLLDGIETHVREVGVVISCAKALKFFPMSHLCDLKVPRTKGKMIASLLASSPPQTVALAGTLGDVVRTVLRAVAAWVGDPDGEQVCEACLHSLYEACEAATLEPELVERFFFTITSADIELIFRVIKLFPNNFRVQESCAGLLAQIIATGVGTEESVIGAKKNAAPELVLPVTSSTQRLADVLQCDPQFEILLSAMGKFTMDDKGLLGKHTLGASKTFENTISRAARSNFSVTSSRSRSTRITGGVTTTSGMKRSASASISASGTGGGSGGDKGDLFEQVMKEGYDEGWYEALLVNDQGEHVTAASLQKNVAMVIGTACNHKKEIQQILCDTNFNELVLLALQNFRTNVPLLQYGCHALLSTCRGSSLQQRMLHELHILNRLCEALNMHKDVWEVTDGVVCALLGLLEPSDTRKVMKAMDKEKSDSYRVARAITYIAPDKVGSLLTYLCSSVMKFLINPECHQLVCNFMLLLNSITYWIPALLPQWNVKLLQMNKELALHFVREAGRARGRSERIKELTNTVEDSEGKLDSNEKSNHKVLTTLQIAAKTDCTLMMFVQLALKYHSEASHVVGACLGLITATLLNSLPTTVPFGGALPYAEDKGRALLDLRQELLESDILTILLDGVLNETNNPVQIRYTLWLFMLFISEPRPDDGRTDFDTYSSSGVAATISIKQTIEWVIEIIRSYPNYYSIQCLAAMFLIWMENHGRFQTRKKKLIDLQKLLEEVAARPADSFLTLDDEGFDTNLYGATFDTFGRLTDHINRILLLLEDRLQTNANGAVSEEWDGRCSPFALAVIGVESEEDPVSLHMYNNYVVQVYWDDEIRWTVSKRFSFFLDLQTKLHAEFVNVAICGHTLVKPPKKLMTVRAIESKEHCRKVLDTWIREISNTRAVLFSEHLLAFLDVANNVTPERFRRLKLHPADEAPAPVEHPITSIAYDPLSDIYFVGSGFVQGALGKLFVGAKVRGTVSLYSTSSRVPQTVLRFSAGVMSLAWDVTSRCLYVGLANGSIVYYTLTPIAPYQLDYLCEINFHTHPVGMLYSDPVQHRIYSTSVGGSIECYNTAEGATVAQGIAKTGNTITSSLVVPDMGWVVCGTNQGSLMVFDANQTPARLIRDYPIIPNSTAPSSPVLALWYEEECQLLYAAMDNCVHLLRLPQVQSELVNPEWAWSTPPLQLRASAQITQLVVLLGGKYVVASCGAEGTVVVFAMTKRPHIVVDRSKSTAITSSATAGLEEEVVEENLATAAAKQLPWQKAALLPNAGMRTWFQSLGVNAADALNRKALLQLLMKTCKIDKTALATALIPPAPAKDVMLMYTLRPVKENNKVYVTSLAYLDNLRAVACGCADGTVQLLSLADFLPAESPGEARDKQRELAEAVKLFEAAEFPLKGSKTAVGKRLQM